MSELSSDRLGVDGRADSDRERRAAAAEGGDEERRVAVFEGGQETSRVMNFSTRCFRRVTRTRTGVRKQVVADICSARGPGCPCYPLAPLHASIPPPSLSQQSPFVSPPPSLSAAARSQTAGLSADAEERQKMRVKQFFSPFFCGLTFSARGPSTPKVEWGWTQLQCRTCPRHK